MDGRSARRRRRRPPRRLRATRLASCLAGSALVSTALVAALVFGSSLTSLVETPRSYGWSWDLSAMTGGGYGDLDSSRARAALDNDPAVATWTAFGFLNELSVDGDPTMAMTGVERHTPEVELPAARRRAAEAVRRGRPRPGDGGSAGSTSATR